MTKETLVIFVNLVVHQCLLLDNLAADRGFETLDDLLEDRLVEHQLLAIHHGRDITTSQQLASLQNNTVSPGIQHVHPQFLIQDLTREDQHLHLRVQFLRVTTDLHADGGRSPKAEIKQHEVGNLLLEQSPVGWFRVCCTNHFRLWDVRADYTEGAFQFEGHILNDNDFEMIHVVIYDLQIYDLLHWRQGG